MTLASLDGFNAPETIWDYSNLVLDINDGFASHGDCGAYLLDLNCTSNCPVDGE
jgi:hypothetical protein